MNKHALHRQHRGVLTRQGVISRQLHRGFSLIEMAIVMLVIGLLLGGLLAPLSAQIEQQRTTETRSQMEEVKRALIGLV